MCRMTEGVAAMLVVWLVAAGGPALGAGEVLGTPLALDSLDPVAFGEWADGQERPLGLADGPRHVIWTQSTAPQWDGVRYADSKTAGRRHLRIGWKAELEVGAILVRGGGQVSVLRPEAAYPGQLDDDGQWLPARRLRGREVVDGEAGPEDYCLWTLPPGTRTRAVRFSHTAAPTDRVYGGWLGGAYLLGPRLVNVAPQAVAAASANDEGAGKLNNESNDGTWGAWENGPEGGTEVITAQNAPWVLLTWPSPVRLRGLCALWAGFGAAQVQTYTGPAEQHPREAAQSDWQTVRDYEGLENQYPRALGPNWLDFGEGITTRAVRVRLTQVTQESHPHLNGNTRGGKRVWLGELMALAPLGEAGLETAVLPEAARTVEEHPPIPVRFSLPEEGYVTLVIEDGGGVRVRNLVSETRFGAGENVAWWDGMDDLGRDLEAAHHGVYHTPGQFVAPGTYRVRGLWHKAIELRYEFSVYNGGHPAWETADHTGGWLTNHTPPSSALYVPGDRAPGGEPLVYLGSYVAEGGDGLAWVDLSGRKKGGRGWVGGVWTGAPYLALDSGAGHDPNTTIYAGAAWEDALRLTALTPQGDRAVVQYSFPGGKEAAALSGLAARDGLLVCSLPKRNELLLVDAMVGRVRAHLPLDDPRGLAFDAQGRLLALSGTKLLRTRAPYVPETEGPVTLGEVEVVVDSGLQDPQHVALDPEGNLYVSDRGSSHQVKVFTAQGAPLRAIGNPGEPQAGPYDRGHMNNPNGLTIDEKGQLWVAETDFSPKRVSVWTLEGELLRAYYGPGQYGGGGSLDPRDKRRFYYTGLEFGLDWAQGTDEPVAVIFRPGPGELQPPDGWGANGLPETPLHANGRQYMTNCYNSNPTNGTPIACLWMMREGIARPVAALGRANDWSLLKGEAFRPRWPQGVDLTGDLWQNQALFTWSDANDDGQAQPEEVSFVAGSCGGVTVMPDLAMVVSRVGDRAVRFAALRFSAGGAPVYDLDAGETLVTGVQAPTTSGGDQALVSGDGWTVLTVAPKPFGAASMGGVYKGEPKWSYPSLWPGLHASHESPAPDHPGELIGTTRLLGGFVTPRGSDAGPLWCVNGNQGNMYLFTEDGLFVATLFEDVRQGQLWAMPVAQRNMLLNGLTLHDENFWPSITQTVEGTVYLVDGARTSLVRVDGLESIRRLEAPDLEITEEGLEEAQAYFVQAEAQRQRTLGQASLKVELRDTAPVVDGRLDDWAGAEWATVDKRGVAAYFDSNSRPYDVKTAAAVAEGRLFAAFQTGDRELLRNSGEVPNAPFKTGGALDLMLGTDAGAPADRQDPVAGDERLLVTVVEGQTLALLYRAVVPGTWDPVPFSSPWRTVTIDRVEDISGQVTLAGAEGSYELSVPLAALGLEAREGEAIKGDLGILRGNGFQTMQRVYWSNKATGITADVPSEAALTPQLWGRWEFVRRP